MIIPHKLAMPRFLGTLLTHIKLSGNFPDSQASLFFIFHLPYFAEAMQDVLFCLFGFVFPKGTW
jgi:hypothetical protein